MRSDFMIAFIVLLGAMLLSRVIIERGMRQLTAEQKGHLMQTLSKHRLYQFAFIILITGGYFFLLKYQIAEISVLYVSYVVIFIAYFVITTWMNYNKLKSEGYEQKFIIIFLAGSSVRIGGVMVLLLLLMGDIVK